jgi:hypothetical protein
VENTPPEAAFAGKAVLPFCVTRALLTDSSPFDRPYRPLFRFLLNWLGPGLLRMFTLPAPVQVVEL